VSRNKDIDRVVRYLNCLPFDLLFFSRLGFFLQYRVRWETCGGCGCVDRTDRSPVTGRVAPLAAFSAALLLALLVLVPLM
jgi:hypothetical protein